MISYVIEAAKYGKDVILVLIDDTDVFVLLVYWVYRAEMMSKVVQIERWYGTVVDINATCADLGPQRSTETAETSIESARFILYTRNKKSNKVNALPTTSPNVFLHVLRAHLQTLLWKEAGQQSPPCE